MLNSSLVLRLTREALWRLGGDPDRMSSAEIVALLTGRSIHDVTELGEYQVGSCPTCGGAAVGMPTSDDIILWTHIRHADD